MIKVYAKNDCGCCTTEMQFESEAGAQAVFAKVGPGNGMVITDDAGVMHEGLDTFYGFSTSEAEEGDRSLGYLFDKVKKLVPG